mgnify:CR=1 FL=1
MSEPSTPRESLSPSDSVNVALVVPCHEAEGPGKRWALWVQGCPILCPGCCNPEFLAEKERDRRSVDDLVGEHAVFPRGSGLLV